MQSALQTLGYVHTYHGLDNIQVGHTDWATWERAADATFFNKGPRLTREEWDELLGHCMATTDIPSLFAEELISVYPESKVVLVERNVDTWYKSFDDAVIGSLFGRSADFTTNVLEPLLGSRAGVTNRKMVFGFFDANDVDGVKRNLKRKYTEHYDRIRRIVPKERLLEFKLADGWAPLCTFFGKDVPVGEFPRVNETEALKKKVDGVKKEMLRLTVRKYGPAFVAVGVAVGAYFMLR
jgi:hypothetical protein